MNIMKPNHSPDRAVPYQPDALDPEGKKKSLRIKLPGFLGQKKNRS
jgi:hypothetical protein